MQGECVPEQLLRQFSAGQLLDDEIAQVSTHLARCPQCQTRTHQLSQADAWASALRRPLAEWTPVDQRILARLLTDHQEPAAGHPRTAPVLPTTLVGAHFGPYRLERWLGAASYLARDQHWHRTVVLQIFPDAHLRAAVTAVSTVQHPHLVRIYQVGVEADQLYVAQEPLAGQTLAQACQHRRQFPVDTVLRLGAEIADGLAALHHAGLAHGHLCPAQVWLAAPHGRVKILGAGLAPTASASPVPESGSAGGGSPAADIYRLGSLLGELLAGHPSPAGNGDSPARPPLPAVIDTLLQRMSARVPADRPTAREVSAQLRSPPARGERPRRGFRWWSVLLAVLVGLGSAGLVYWWLTQR
jgi:hypothetical protein